MKKERVGKWVLSALLWMWTGGIYFFMEVVWKTFRDRPETIHWTMFLTAIIIAVPMERFGAELPWSLPLPGQAAICTCGITAVEFVAGLILNVWLGLGVWDYSHMPGNLMGQICPQFVGVWLLLSFVGVVMLDWMRYAVEGGERPHYTFDVKRGGALGNRNGDMWRKVTSYVLTCVVGAVLALVFTHIGL